MSFNVLMAAVKRLTSDGRNCFILLRHEMLRVVMGRSPSSMKLMMANMSAGMVLRSCVYL
jgi:hypothetical protein